MKIADVRTHVLEFKLDEPIGSSIGLYTIRQAMLVEVITDMGPVGWGEAHGWSHACSSLIDTALRPMILGRDPTDIRVLWHEMYTKTRHFGQKGVTLAAISAIDIALWDILGKQLGAPVHKLLGGTFRDSVQAYAMGLFYSPGETTEDLQKKAHELVQSRGFCGIKMKVGGASLKEDCHRVAAVREAIGPDVLLMVDANRAYNASAAIAVGRALAAYDVFWFEEPVPPEDIQGYCSVKSALPMFIAGGECEFTRYGFRTLFDARAVDIVQPEICSAGGISECRHIAELAFTAGIFYVPHMHGSALSLAANLQLVASLPPVSVESGPHPPLIELDTAPNPLREQLLQEPLELCEGRLKVPESPGLGININRTVVEKFRV